MSAAASPQGPSSLPPPPPTTALQAWAPVLGLVTAMLLWSSSFVAMKVAVQAYGPVFVVFGRMAVGAALFALVARRLIPRGVPRRDIGLILLMALCEPCLYYLFEANALRFTSASQAGMVTAILPLMVAATAFWTLRERCAARVWIGFAMALVGVVWLTAAGESTAASPNPALGNFLEFCAMVCATGYMVLLKRLSSRYSPWLLTASQALVGALFYLPGLFLPGVWPERLWNPTALAAVLFLGSFVTIGAYGLYNYGMSRLPASKATAFINLIPVFTVAWGWLLLDERLNTMQLAAGALVLAGVFLSQGGVTEAAPACSASPDDTPDGATDASPDSVGERSEREAS